MSNIIWTFAVRIPAASKTDEIRQPQKWSLKFEQTLHPIKNFLAIYFDFFPAALAVSAAEASFALTHGKNQLSKL